jgi:hypothetical protein
MIYERKDWADKLTDWELLVLDRYVIYLMNGDAYLECYITDTFDDIKPEHKDACALLDTVREVSPEMALRKPPMEGGTLVGYAKLVGVGRAQYYSTFPPVYHLSVSYVDRN